MYLIKFHLTVRLFLIFQILDSNIEKNAHHKLILFIKFKYLIELNKISLNKIIPL